MGVPKDFEEAARIDGANAFQIYWRIFMPIMKPQLILVGVLNMITVWNDYLGPLIFLQDRSKFTLALGLASFKGVHSTQIIPMLCITVIMMIIALIFRQFLYLFLDPTRRFQAFIIVVIVAAAGGAFYGYSVLKIRLADRLLGKNAAKLRAKFNIK